MSTRGKEFNSVLTRAVASRGLSICSASAVMIALPAVAVAQDTQTASSKFDAVEALGICEALFQDASATKGELLRSGWSVPEEDISPVYEEADAAALQKDDLRIIFVGPQSSMAVAKPDFSGSCQIVANGNSVVAATALAAHFEASAIAFEPSNGRVYNSVVFLIDNTLIETASLNETNTALRLQYVPGFRTAAGAP